MVIIIQDNGKMIKLMDMVFIIMQGLEQNIKATGKMICNTDLEFNSIVMVVNIKECLNKEKDMAMVYMFLQIKQYMMDNG